MARLKTIAIASQKGGAGKTTTALMLASAAYHAGQRSVIMDADAQGTSSLGVTRAIEENIVDTERLVARKISGTDLSQFAMERIVEVGTKAHLDWMFFDLPPILNCQEQAISLSCDLVFMPLYPNPGDWKSTEQSLEVLSHFGVTPLIVMNRVPTSATADKVAYANYIKTKEMATNSQFGLVCPVEIHQRGNYGLMTRRPSTSTTTSTSAAAAVYKRQD